MSKEAIFEALARFRASWVARGWSWDRRLECVASTFDVSRRAAALRAVQNAFPQEWTHETIARAPERIVAIADVTEGVREGQVLFAIEGGELLCFALWWPWGGETTNTSLRVGLSDAPYDDVIRLREVFGALDD